LILAPLRGVTIRCFRETFADELRAAGFDEAITPFIPAMAGYDPLSDRELAEGRQTRASRTILVTPQFIGKDPAAFRTCLERVKAAGYGTADLNCGCPFPMVRNKGRGSGLLRTPDVLRRMMEVGCETMGAGRFSVKTRLGIDRTDELLGLMPLVNEFPLRFLTLHARTARQMYGGACDRAAFERIAAVAKVPIVYNGDAGLPPTSLPSPDGASRSLMVCRAFVRRLGEIGETNGMLLRYLDASVRELSGDRPVLGRIKELIAYWKDLPAWRRRWDVVKLVRTVAELRQVIGWRGVDDVAGEMT